MDTTSCAIIFLSLALTTFVETTNYTNEKTLMKTLLTDYDKNVRPRKDDERTNITVVMNLKSVTSLDAVNGILITTCSIFVSWTDENLSWEPSNHGNITDIAINRNLIWSPLLILANPAIKAETLGEKVGQVYLSWTGNVEMHAGHVLHSTCDIDVTLFPFDTQHCVVELLPWGLMSKDMNVISRPLGTMLFSENNVWILKSSSAETAFHGKMPYAKIFLILERRFTFYILNLFLPVLILAVLNTMVFLLPASSGERTGYAITCLLSLSVYMTFASESLPNSSQPLPIITSVLLTYIVISALICGGTIIGLTIHLHKTGPPPSALLKFCNISYRRCNRKTKSGDPNELKTMDGEEMEDKNNMDWTELANKYDRLCFIVSNVGIIFLTVLYFIIVLSGK